MGITGRWRKIAMRRAKFAEHRGVSCLEPVLLINAGKTWD